MAVNTFTFGSITSSTYGIYVSGEALFNAPKRSAEVVTIPGRDGAYILDKGSFENIDVTYRVFNQEKDLADFRTKLANLRSALCSQIGYKRLTDTFHPDEYRMAAFIDGVEVKPVMYNTASEFELKFNCKPQRFLTSGETATAVASGGTVTNPTPFDARPMLEVVGYGNIDMGGQGITVNNQPIGQTLVYGGGTSGSFKLDLSALETGDDFIVSGATKTVRYYGSAGISAAISSTTNCTATVVREGIKSLLINITASDKTFQKGTDGSQTSTVTYTITNGGTTTTVTTTLHLHYDSSISRIEFGASNSTTVTNTSRSTSTKIPQLFGDSTKPILGNPLYIDLDIGEAYKYESGVPVSVNNGVVIPAELPTLPSGATTITYDNTFTSVKVMPRWWKV